MGLKSFVLKHLGKNLDHNNKVIKFSKNVAENQYLVFRFSNQNYDPSEIENGGTWTRVEGSAYNDWKWGYDSRNWTGKFANCFNTGYAVSVIDGNTTDVTNMSKLFMSCMNLESVTMNDVSNLRNASQMFDNCKQLITVDMQHTNAVTDMHLMFHHCDDLTVAPNLDTSSVKNMINMFSYCQSLTTVPVYDTSSVTKMAGMFDHCTALTTAPGLNTSKVKYAENMFDGCTALTEVPDMDLPECVNMNSMFKNCENVNSGALDLYTAMMDSTVTHTDTFTNCGIKSIPGLAELKQIPKDWGGLKEELAANTLRFRFEDENYDPSEIQNGGTWSKVNSSTYNDWDWTFAAQEEHFDGLFIDAFDETTCVSIIKAGDLSNVVSTSSLFENCSGLTSICDGLFTAAEVADNMFYGCTLLESIPVDLCSNIHIGRSMFVDCVSLTSIPEGVFNELSDGRNMFAGCVGLTSLPTTLFPSLTNGDEMFADCINVSEGAYELYDNFAKSGNVTMHYHMFTNCGSNNESGLYDLTQIPKDWGGLMENIAANTLRFHFDDNSYTPSSNKGSWVKVSDDGTDGCVWDWHCDDNDWSDAFSRKFTTTRATMIEAGNTFDVTNMDSMFDACSALDSIVLFDTSNVTNMQFMFNKCTSLTEVPLFDTSNVTTMRDMFYQCTSLAALPLFDTVNVTDMSYLCYECTSLTAVPLLDTSNVTAMDNAFAYCKNVETGALALYESASDGIVESHNDTFVLCGKNTNGGLYDLEQIPTDWGGLPLPANTLRFRFEDPDFDPSAKTYTVVNNWTGEVSEEVRPISSVGTWTKVTYSEYNDWNWYYDKNYWSSSLKGALVDTPTRLILAGDTSSVIHMEYLFQDCTQLVSIDAPIDTNSVEYAFEMFSGCTSLQKIPDLDLSNATDDNSFKNMFKGCSSLVTAPKLTLPSTTLVDLDYMFRDCTSLTTVPLFDTSNVQSMRSMFFECTSLTDVPLFDTSNVTDMHSMFDNCTSLTTVPLFDTSNVTNMSGMLFGCSSLSVIPLFDTTSVHDVSTMFCNCESVTAGALEFYNSVKDKTYEEGGTQKPVSHYNTFTNCGSEEVRLQIPVDWGGLKVELPANTLRFRFENTDYNPTVIENGGTWTKVTDSEFNDWDWTCNVTNWSNKFGMKLTENLDKNIQIIAAGDTSSVTIMSYMFYGCTSLTSVPLFNTSKVNDMSSMFNGCTSLTNVPLFDTSNVTEMYSMFEECKNIQSGMLDLYQQASSTGKVTDYFRCFTDAGTNTESGRAELNQIPVDWGGLAE
ncbi:MAG: BspA family leucine-rich repeat surface protein [Fibrobacter sp.]|nr:BspA family leucine-rich repeat surface protein [Fibrobacter sp.]